MMEMENYVGRLNEHAHKTGSKVDYEDVASEGPDHIRKFTIRAVVNGKAYPDGVGKNRKEARQNAAKNALSCLLEESTENTAEASPAPVHQTSIRNINYTCWLNEYCQKNRVTIRGVESIKLGPSGPIQCCSFVVGDKEYPAASGKTKKEAKEEAAKFVYNAIHGCKTTETGDDKYNETPSPQKEELNQTLSDICDRTKNVSVQRTNFIEMINGYCQKTNRSHAFIEDRRCGPAHSHQFFYKLVINNKEYPVGEGKTVKEAKQNAAQLAWAALQEQPDWDSKTASAQQNEELTQNVNDISDRTRGLNLNSTKTNFKGIINHYCQTKKLAHSFIEKDRRGPPHDPTFFYILKMEDKEYPVGEGKSSQEAKQNAAELAWAALQEQSDWDSKVSVRSTASEDGAPPTAMDTSDSASQSTTTTSSLSRDPLCHPPSQSTAISTNSPMMSDSSNPTNKEDAVKSSGTTNSVSNISPQSSGFTSNFDSIECLGQGGFGRVYKAREILLDKFYAIKVVCGKKNALREVVALSDLHHPNIVRYYNCWMENAEYTQDSVTNSWSTSESNSDAESQYLYIKMELCETKTLNKWIKEQNKTVPQDTKRGEKALNIALQIISGVEHIHYKKLIHRDLKPVNIMFGLDEKLKIGDFGLVTNDNEDDKNRIERTNRTGTRSYMAPEQENEKTYDRKVDIFAVGLIYFELLWTLSTGHEKATIWKDARSKKFPKEFSVTFSKENHMIKLMLCEKPEDRPEASALKAQMEEWTIKTTHRQKNVTQ